MDSGAAARRDAWFAYAAGTVGAIANVALIAFYALQANHPKRGDSRGVSNDLIGAAGSALLIPITLRLSRNLPRRLAVNATQGMGVAAEAILTITGLLLVFDVVPFAVATPISLTATWACPCGSSGQPVVAAVAGAATRGPPGPPVPWPGPAHHVQGTA